MFQPLYVAATGLSSIEEEISNITNNLANAKTVAFKKGRTEMESLFFVEKSFKDYLNEAVAGTSVQPVNVEYGTGVRVASTPKAFTQGTMETTSNQLDLGIQGDGFFQLKMPDGSLAYTRAGNFHIDNDGNIVDNNGRLLDPALIVPSETTAILIQQDGTVLAQLNNSTSYTELGQIPLAKFTNPAGLRSIGQNLYQETEASGQAVSGTANQETFGAINQFALEQSNVDVITEMMNMVVAQRIFDTVTKAVQSYDGMLTKLEGMKS